MSLLGEKSSSRDSLDDGLEGENLYIEKCFSDEHGGWRNKHSRAIGTIKLTLEQQPPNIRLSMAPTVSKWGMVSMKIRPARPTNLERVVL